MEAHWDDIQRISMGTAREDLTRLSVELQPGTVDWLEDLGVEWDPITPRLVFGHEPYRTARTVHTSRMAVPIAEALERALAPHVESGRIEVRLSTPAAGLVVDGGRVTGVRTESGDVVEARDTVLATGGFGHNPELFRRYEKAPLVTSAAPGSTGDGLVMAVEAGAAVQGEGKYLPTFGGLPPEPGEFRVDWVHRPHLVAPERKPWEIYVDQTGRRWINEEEPSIDRKERVLVTIPEMTFWTVFDARALRESRPMILGMSPEDVDAAAGVRRGITKADTIAELAERAGIAADGLAATVARYNHATVDGARGRPRPAAPPRPDRRAALLRDREPPGHPHHLQRRRRRRRPAGAPPRRERDRGPARRRRGHRRGRVQRQLVLLRHGAHPGDRTRPAARRPARAARPSRDPPTTTTPTHEEQH